MSETPEQTAERRAINDADENQVREYLLHLREFVEQMNRWTRCPARSLTFREFTAARWLPRADREAE